MVLKEQFTGYAAESEDSYAQLKKIRYTPKPFGEYDVDIKVEYCGVCGSDLHTLRNGWAPAPTEYPVVVGHEIAGKVVRVGSKVSSVEIGQMVGVGAVSSSCGTCKLCNNGLEQYCSGLVETYNSKYPDGSKSWGGYSDYVRLNERFVFPIPVGLDAALAAPMLCAGLTVYSPLVQEGAGPGKRVAVIGVGGLGHLAIIFAAALGAEVTAISRGHSKEADARKMGATRYIDSSPGGWEAPFSRSFDLIINTSNAPSMPLESFLTLLDPEILIGANIALRGSSTGSKNQALDMLALAAKMNLKSWIQEMPMSACSRAIEELEKGNARYRYVLKADWDEKGTALE